MSGELFNKETLPPVRIEDQVRCVERELGMRHRVYARRVKQGAMNQSTADEEIRRMTAVRDSLVEIAQLRARVARLEAEQNR